ncbi:MAG: chromosomal replication initiator protein DnaA [Candidatus Brocadiia bacterium]
MSPLTEENKQKILDHLKSAVDQAHFERWLKGIEFIDAGNNAIDVPLPNVYYRQLYEKNYQPHIEKAIRETMGNDYKLTFSVKSESKMQLGQGVLPLWGNDAPPAGNAPSEPPKKPGLQFTASNNNSLTLNNKYTFDKFIVGPCNRMAHVASLAVAENPGKSYNPLFIHGSVGLGKTHLLQAICQTVMGRSPNTTIIYRSCEGFVNDYIAGIKSGKLEGFRDRYRSVDILVIDDIHFLGMGEKHASQEEFFHTFNALHNAQKQIILSSDSQPKDIPTLEERLVSRFKWGMVVRLDPPTYETKAAILTSKAETNQVAIPEDVISFLATNINTNIRDLEGVIHHIKLLADTNKSKIDMDLAKKAFADVIGIDVHQVTISDIQKIISTHFNVTVVDLQSKKRTRPIATARQVGVYLAKTFNPQYSLEEIGDAFGGRDHSTVLHSIEIIKQRIYKDKQFKATIELLIADLKRAH